MVSLRAPGSRGNRHPQEPKSRPRFPALARAALACVLALAALATPALAQTGICGRTTVVQTFILGKISGVDACADVTNAHLAAITGSLPLNSESITALAAGDFAGLTSLTKLNLDYNDLTALPADVFDELTALTELRLIGNDLATLPAGVFDELTALTHLYLRDNDLAALPSGVFNGLSALTVLGLNYNDLTALPADVFDPSTSLTSLSLDHNDLASLPAGVFDALTSLTYLSLHENELTTLPADVFEPLTSLTGFLFLDDNPGAPFAPVAVALPDDGTVSSAGGTVMLDGSGSDGGPWGGYVTYSWTLTTPSSGVTVTFDDAGSATPVATIPALAGNTELTFTLTVAPRSGSDGVTRGTDTATVSVPATNATPSFTSAAAFNAAENQTAVGTVQASDGDSSDSVTGYAIEGGADASKFTIGAATGVLAFASPPNFEDLADADGDNAYVVVVRATSGAGARVKTADQTITVTVTDVGGEAPGVPAVPTVASAGVTSLTAFWTAPSNTGPPITDYDYQYRVKSPPGSWTEVTDPPITALGATITMLVENTEYEVQVRSTNEEGTSGWSASGSGQTTASVPGTPGGGGGGGGGGAPPPPPPPDEDPEVEASFGSASYEAPEGGTVEVTVVLSGDPEREVSIPLVRTHRGGASDADYSGVPEQVTFSSGVTSRTFEFAAAADSEEDFGESVTLGFGSLPAGVSGAGSATVSIRDDDTPPMAVIEVSGAECDGELCRALTGEPVQFADASTGPVASRRWEFGDGSESDLPALAHSWTEPGFYDVTLWVSDGARESTASRVFLVESSPAGMCESSAERLCLQDSRYAVTVDWWTADSNGRGRVVHAGTNDSGLFTFFNRENWEVLIKVLDGCAHNGHVWVYGASTTDVGYTIQVTDTVTGTVKQYRNEPGLPAPAITDATAFVDGCRR